MTDTTTISTTTAVDTYLAMWNEEDADRRLDLIRAAWAPGGRYADPMFSADGHDELSAMVAGVHEQLPGHRFTRTTGIDVHHDQLRFGWQLAAPDGTVAVAGIDVGTTGDDGRLQRITGFFGEIPAEG